MERSLTDPWTLGGIEIQNRVVLAPLAGIGNWFVRLQAKRHGAGLVVSEMVSSFGLKYGDERTHREFLRIHPEEHPVAIQLFGHDPDVMREAAAIVSRDRRRLDRHQHGLPRQEGLQDRRGRVSLLDEQDKAVALAKRRGRGRQRHPRHRQGPQRPAPRRANGHDARRRLVDEAGVAGIGFHPRHASQQHKGKPDYATGRGAGRDSSTRR